MEGRGGLQEHGGIKEIQWLRWGWGKSPLRRHMTKGQRAMAVAMIYPEPEKRGRGNKRSASGQFSGVPTQRVSEARAVLAYSREIA